MRKKRLYLKLVNLLERQLPEKNNQRIEIILNQEVEKYERKVKRELVRKGLPASWGEIGIIYEDSYCYILRDLVRFPSGHVGTFIRFIWKHEIEGKGGVAVIPVTPEGKIVLIGIFRHATRSWELEIPRGSSKDATNIESMIKEELLAETGYSPVSITHVGSVLPNTGILSENLQIFFAKVRWRKQNKPEKSELIEASAREVNVTEFEDLIVRGKIRDAITVSAYTHCKLRGLI